jgi:hypothetical protein
MIWMFFGKNLSGPGFEKWLLFLKLVSRHGRIVLL